MTAGWRRLGRVHRAPDTGVYVVASGWGERAGWFRNIQQHPGVYVTVGTRRFAARAARLGHAEAAAVISGYARAHPLAFAVVTRLVTGRRVPPVRAECELLARLVPLIALNTRSTLPAAVDDRRFGRGTVARLRGLDDRAGPLPA